jgi:hypothetical protein
MEEFSAIFHKEKKGLRIIIILFLFVLTMVLFFKFRNIFLGTVALYCTSYFLGTFKTRSRIKIFDNKEFESAIAEIRKLVDGSTEEIKILCYHLNPVIYNQENILTSFKNAIDRRVKISIICNYKKMITVHNDYSLKKQESILKYAINRSLVIYDIDKDLKLVNHFLVVDGKSFRFEKVHDEKNDSRKGIVVYNCDQAKKLSKLFDEMLLKDHCKRIPSEEIELTLDNIL